MVLLAVLLMPFGMAPGAAMPVAHSSTAMGMPMGHCPEQGSHGDLKGGIAECTMACAGALPAVGQAVEPAPSLVNVQAEPAAPAPLHGLHPDTATPPPKRS
jgi:hypothetical protein